MGNSSAAQKKKLDDLRGMKDELRIFLVGDLSLIPLVLGHLDSMFKQPNDPGLDTTNSTQIFEYTCRRSPKTRYRIHIVGEMDEALRKAISWHLTVPCLVVWLIDSEFHQKQERLHAQSYAAVTCLPLPLCSLISSYHGKFDIPGASAQPCREFEVRNTCFFHIPWVSDENSERIFSQLRSESDASEYTYADFEQAEMFEAAWRQIEKHILFTAFSGTVDIGQFGQHEESPGIEILRDGALGCSSFMISPQIVRSVIRQVAASRDRSPVWDAQFVFGLSALDLNQCQTIVSFLEQHAASHSEQRDFKMNISVDELCWLIGRASYEKLTLIFGRVDEIKLRRAEGSSENSQCINFHLDYNYRTLQVALNGDDQYEGGRLTYLVGDEVRCPSRPAGCYTLHENNIVHGVSSLLRGKRYGLFLLQNCQ